jgi:hypothetical protein
MFEPSDSLALANVFASCSLRKVSVVLSTTRWPRTRSFGAKETYQVPLDLLGRGPLFTFPAPSPSTLAYKYPRLAGLDEQPAILFSRPVSLASRSAGHFFFLNPISTERQWQAARVAQVTLSGPELEKKLHEIDE